MEVSFLAGSSSGVLVFAETLSSNTLPAISPQIEPVKSQCSTFFGELDDVYEPILVPAACPPPIGDASTCPHGAKQVRAGDVVELEVEMHSMLLRALSVTNVSLTLLLVGGRAMKAETGALLH